MEKIDTFVRFCKRTQPQTEADIKRFFEGVIFFPYDKELLLQAFLFLNINRYFRCCTELLLFERSPNGENNTDQGKCDFVYLTQDKQVALIETKFIDTENTGETERKRRTSHKKKVFDQVFTLKQKFSSQWDLPAEAVTCGVFTTADLSSRSESAFADVKHVSMEELRRWQQEMKKKLKSLTDAPGQVTAPQIEDTINESESNILSQFWMQNCSCDFCPHPDVCATNKICYYDLCGSD